jgi:hypothetical protein
MEEPANTSMELPQDEKTSEGKGIGRRRLLKTLIASGGVVALTGLPNKWARPVVEAGELSVHAEASPALRIRDLRIGFVDNVSSAPLSSGRFDFEDYYAGVTEDTASLAARVTSNGTLDFGSDPSAGVLIDGPVPAEILQISGAGETTGQIFFRFGLNSSNGFDLQFCVKLIAEGRVSNELCQPLKSG